MTNISTLVRSLSALLLLSGCQLAPAYQRPALPLPASALTAITKASPEQMQPPALAGWQQLVREPQLKALLSTVLEHNLDLRQALLNVAVAKAEYGIQQSERWPQLQAQASSQRQMLPADLSAAGRAQYNNTVQAGLALSAFELDLFGRLQQLSAAALQQYLAETANANAVRLSLVAELMQQYAAYQLGLHQVELASYTLQSRQQELQLVQQQRQIGSATALQVQEALAFSQSARAEWLQQQRQLQQRRHALQLLAGSVDVSPYLPQLVRADKGQPTLLLAPFPTQLSSELLLQRPDIMAAEHQLQARNAQIAAARAAFFPRISLSGLFGNASADLTDLFSGGQRSWSFSPVISVPIFDGGLRQSQLTLAELRTEQAVLTYEQQIQLAFREVSDALTDFSQLTQELAVRQQYAHSSMASRRLVQQRYQAGVDSQFRYLDSQRQSYAAQQALLQSQLDYLQAQIQLYKVLGGGWQDSVNQAGEAKTPQA